MREKSKTPIREEHRRRERGRGERERGRDGRKDITINKKEEEERPHGRLTLSHGRDPRHVPGVDGAVRRVRVAISVRALR